MLTTTFLGHTFKITHFFFNINLTPQHCMAFNSYSFLGTENIQILKQDHYSKCELEIVPALGVLCTLDGNMF